MTTEKLNVVDNFTHLNVGERDFVNKWIGLVCHSVAVFRLLFHDFYYSMSVRVGD